MRRWKAVIILNYVRIAVIGQLKAVAQAVWAGRWRVALRESCAGFWRCMRLLKFGFCKRGVDRRFAMVLQAIRMAPHAPSLRMALADFQMAFEQHDDAFLEYAQAIRLGAARRHALQCLMGAFYYISTKRPDRIEKCIEEIAALRRHNATCPVLAYHLGSTLLKYQRVQEALDLADEALGSNPAAAELHALRGIALQQLGQPGEALRAMDRCNELDPAFAQQCSLNATRGYLLGLRGELKASYAALALQFREIAPVRNSRELGAYLARSLSESLAALSLRGTVGVFFGVTPDAYGHSILDPFQTINLFAHRFDNLVMVHLPLAAYSKPETKLSLKILDQYVDRIETANVDALFFSWHNLGLARHKQYTFLLHTYYGLNQLAFQARHDAESPIREARRYFRLPPKMNRSAEGLCRRNNLDIDRPVVVWHVREHGYHQQFHQSYRNTDVSNYIPALRELASEGYLIVRLGDASMTSVRDRVPGIIELPLLDWYDPLLDAYFISRCQFMISCQSGPCSHARVFGRPNLVLNAVYHYSLIPECQEILGFKRYVNRHTGVEMSLEQILEIGCQFFDRTEHFEKAGIELKDMTPKEILGAVEEMKAWLHDAELPETEAQLRFREMMIQTMQENKDHPLRTPLMDYMGYSLAECRLSETMARERPGYLSEAPKRTPRICKITCEKLAV